MALTLEKFWDRTGVNPGDGAKLKVRESEGKGEDGTPSEGEGGTPGEGEPNPNLPTIPTGSFGFFGSFGFVGSGFSFVGSGGTFGFIGSNPSIITSITSIPSIQFLPLSAPPGLGYLIQNTGQLFYWDNGWILAASL
jgi:hypothetical protein